MKALATLDTCASYGTLTGQVIERKDTGEQFRVIDLIDTPSGLAVKVRPLFEELGSPVWMIPWMYRRNYSIVAEPACGYCDGAGGSYCNVCKAFFCDDCNPVHDGFCEDCREEGFGR